jgi:hypothetical protein
MPRDENQRNKVRAGMAAHRAAEPLVSDTLACQERSPDLDFIVRHSGTGSFDVAMAVSCLLALPIFGPTCENHLILWLWRIRVWKFLMVMPSEAAEVARGPCPCHHLYPHVSGLPRARVSLGVS